MAACPLYPNAAVPARPYTRSRVAQEKKRDHYEVLGVPKTATKAEIKKAYYQVCCARLVPLLCAATTNERSCPPVLVQLAKKYHPDANKDDKNASKKFAEVAEAYDVLSDENKKSLYDKYAPEFLFSVLG